MNGGELLRELRKLAQERIDEVLSADLLVPMSDGTERLALELTREELASMEPPLLRRKVLEFIGAYEAAQKGLVELGDGETKHIDYLTLEDAPKLERVIQDEQDREEAVIEAAARILAAAQHMEEMGIEVDRDRPIRGWLGNG